MNDIQNPKIKIIELVGPVIIENICTGYRVKAVPIIDGKEGEIEIHDLSLDLIASMYRELNKEDEKDNNMYV